MARGLSFGDYRVQPARTDLNSIVPVAETGGVKLVHRIIDRPAKHPLQLQRGLAPANHNGILR